MRDPFKITGPTCLSFSGGRTSAYMLWRVLQAHGGTLPADCHVVYANTGKEKEATLRFVRDCALNWGVPIVWVEYLPDEPGWRLVDFDTASRKGEPFEALIRKRNYLPNPVARFCTVELKILRAVDYMRSLGYLEHETLLGLRADEPARIAKLRADPSGGTKGVERRAPLADAGITKGGGSAVLARISLRPGVTEPQRVNPMGELRPVLSEALRDRDEPDCRAATDGGLVGAPRAQHHQSQDPERRHVSQRPPELFPDGRLHQFSGRRLRACRSTGRGRHRVHRLHGLKD